MSAHAYLIVAVTLGVIALVAVYAVQVRRRATGQTKHSWLSYLLVWPLILDSDKNKRDGKVLTNRELLGWGLVFLVAALAIVFT